MLYNTLTTQNISDYMPQIIGVFGTILGTILGWILHIISDNIEKTYILVDYFTDKKSTHNEYAYIVQIYIYNASHKQQCIRNARLSFQNCYGKNLIKSIPSEGTCNFNKIRSNTNNKRKSMMTINSYAQNEYILSGLIDGEEYDRLPKVRKIYLHYEDKKNHTKKKLVKPNFKITNVENITWDRFP